MQLFLVGGLKLIIYARISNEIISKHTNLRIINILRQGIRKSSIRINYINLWIVKHARMKNVKTKKINN